jgi:SNF2 family DNA or RNA helicase
LVLAEHQRAAVERAIHLLDSRGGLILADETGLGKSFIAAEVMRRFSIETELIVPASLLSQWSETLHRFGVSARVMTHDAIAGDAFIVSPRRRLIVVDEAHAFRNPRTQRYEALARRCLAARLLLVTATPICNSLEDLEALLRLFARDDILGDCGIPSIDAAFDRRDRVAIEVIVAELVIRRDRSVLPPELRFGELLRTVVRHPVPAAPEIDMLTFPLVGENALLRRFLYRRLESSEAALIESVRRQLRFYVRVRSAMAAGRVLPKREYRRAFSHEEDRERFQEVLFWDLFAPAGEVDREEIARETKLLERLLTRLRASPSVKRAMLTELVVAERDPMLVFTGSAATARDLHAELERIRRCGLITSRERTRSAVLHAFVGGKLDLVVSTDATAEGLNLQRAGVVVHYDIPWNPMRLDQRNGRAFRIGQTREAVRAVYFLPESRATRVVETVARKNRLRRQILGGAGTASSTGERVATLRPRLTAKAAFVQLSSRTRIALPESLARRHKAGLEELIEQIARMDTATVRIDELFALVALEP